ncbi:hypothetical protein ACLIA0_13440 [Bacillaceae bacterium W0354]
MEREKILHLGDCLKRLLLLSMSALLVLSACTEKSIQPKENSMILSIKNNGNFDFYSLEISTERTSGGIINADGSLIKKGDTLRMEYIDQEDFNLVGNKTFNFVLLDKEKNKYPLKKMTIELAPNKVYFFEITGKSIREADLKIID